MNTLVRALSGLSCVLLMLLLLVLAWLNYGCQSSKSTSHINIYPAFPLHPSPVPAPAPGVGVASSPSAHGLAPVLRPEAPPAPTPVCPVTINIYTYNDKPVDVRSQGTVSGNSVATGAGAVGGAIGAALGGPAGAALGAAGGSVAATTIQRTVSPPPGQSGQ